MLSAPDAPSAPDKSSYRFFAGTQHFGTNLMKTTYVADKCKHLENINDELMQALNGNIKDV